jgi:hypothetical protein
MLGSPPVTERRDELQASLAEIDRKLRDLQAELQVAAVPEPASPAPPVPPPARPVAEPADDRLAELAGRAERLRQLSAELEDATRSLRDQLGS